MKLRKSCKNSFRYICKKREDFCLLFFFFRYSRDLNRYELQVNEIINHHKNYFLISLNVLLPDLFLTVKKYTPGR